MFSLLRNRFGVPGVISVIALVFAMLGGAYAANDNGSGNATASAKAKKGPRGPRGPRGPEGPQGPAGPAGPAGSAGLRGPEGPEGAQGAVGPKGATGNAGPKGDTGATGPEGSPWTAGGTLPSGKTETGSWLVSRENEAGGGAYTALSFPLPLPAPLSQEEKVHVLAVGEGGTADCPGTYAAPKAAPGNACLYTNVSNLLNSLGAAKSNVGGLLLAAQFEEGPEAVAFGNFAVTAP